MLQFLFSETSFSEELASYWLLTLYITSFFQRKKAVFIGMALHILVRRNCGGKSTVNIKFYNLHSVKKEWFSHVRVSLKRDKYHIYFAQLFLQFNGRNSLSVTKVFCRCSLKHFLWVTEDGIRYKSFAYKKACNVDF